MSYTNINTTLRRAPEGTKAAAGTVPHAGRSRAMTEGAANRTDYMVDDHDPLAAAQALAAADLMMGQIKAQTELTFEERCALKALQQSRSELHVVRMTPSMAFDYCDLNLRFPQFVDAIGSLIKKGLAEAGAVHVWLTKKGVEA